MLNTTDDPSGEDWKRMLDALPDLICTLDSAHKVRWMNAAMAKKLGVTQVEAVGLACYETVHGTTCPPAFCPHRRLLQDQLEHSVEIHEERIGGDFLVTCTPLRDEGGQLVGSVHVARDITEHKWAEQKLLKSEALYRSLFQSNPHPMWVYDLGTLRFLAVNDAAVSHYGYSRDEFLSMTIKDIRPPEDLPRLYSNLKKLPAGGLDNAGVWRYLKKDGSVIDVEITSHVRDYDGRKSEVVLAHDITERKRMVEALAENEERLRLALRAANQGLYDLNVQTGAAIVNPEYAGMLGYDPETFVETNAAWIERLHPDDKEGIAQAYTDYVSGKSPEYRVEFRQKTRDGDWKWILSLGRIVEFDAAGKPLRMLGTHTDITERKQLETERQKFFQLADSSSEFIGICDLEMNPLYVNPAGRRMVGLPDMAAAGRVKVQDYFFPEDETFFMSEVFPRVLREGHLDLEIRLRHFQTGEPIWMDGSIFTVRDSGGQVAGWATTSRDITERKRAEEDKERLRAQLAQAQKMESVGRLAGGVAHDFNNMLAVILGYVGLAQERIGSDEPLYGDLEEIRKAAERSADLTRQLLAFARKQTVAPKVLDLNETVEGMLNMLRRILGEDIDLVWRPGDGAVTVLIDPSQVDQILANLCVNARDAIVGVGKITIETGRTTFDESYCARNAGFVPGEFVMLAVSDNGCGMDAITLGHLFEPFFTTKELGKGTGLGLATVYGAVKQNDGFINVYSEPGHGTTFRIYLPLHSAKALPRPEQEQAAALASGGQVILLVEDEAVLLEMTTRMLKGLGYAVVAAATPGEALRLARERQSRIDLLMTDVVMPEMNGRDLARNLIPIYPDIRRLFMSGYTANVIAHHGVLDPGVHFLQKPFTMKELAAKVREALERD